MVESGEAFLENSTFAHIHNGLLGALRVVRGLLTLNACTFASNAAFLGGAITVIGGSLNLNSCNFVSNLASLGGAIAVAGGKLHAVQCSFTNNDAAYGAALHAKAANATVIANATVERCRVESNFGSKKGGAIFCSTGGRVALVSSDVKFNAANVSGGSLYIEDGWFITTGTMFRQNTAPAGANMMRVGGSFHYALPAVAGRWLASTYLCQPLREPCPADRPSCKPDERPYLPDQPCPFRLEPQLVGRVVAEIPVGPLEDDFPYSCPPGVFGDGNATSQTSPQCAGVCVSMCILELVVESTLLHHAY